MTLLFRVLHAVHARGMHHKIVLDGVQALGGNHAEHWQRLFLKHATVLMQGAKAPDDEFKDFTNHVLHPRDNYWGGAPEKARSWYGHLVEALVKGDWSMAVWCAGVLSHYVTDPVQPLHTAQSEAENNIHRAVEWSTANAYTALKGLAAPDAPKRLAIPDVPNWLEILIADAARDANAHYEKMIAHFDIHRAVVDPAAGLDVVAKRIMAGQLAIATALVTTVLERAIVDSMASPPKVTLGLDTLLALIKIPARLWSKRLANASERALVERMYDELKATGTVEKNLPEDERVVRERFAIEVLAKRAVPDAAVLFPYRPKETVETTVQRRERQRTVASRAIPSPVSKPVAPVIDLTGPEMPISEPPRPAPQAADQLAPLEAIVRRTQSERRTEIVAPVELASPRVVAMNQAVPSAASGPRIYLTVGQDIVDAPSIGPKMAERLHPIGLKTVADLLAASPVVTALALDIRAIDAQTIVDWQDQARLVCTMPGLRGTHAQLLVGAGFRTAAAVAEVEADVLCARVLAFAASTEGHRVLRSGDPPDIEKIKSWLDNARLVQAA